MIKIGVISLLAWMVFRLAFHMFVFDNSDFARFIYFAGNDLALIGLFLLLKSVIKSGILKRMLTVVLIYSGFCLVADILMLIGIGTPASWGYTAISISILSIGLLWLKFA